MKQGVQHLALPGGQLQAFHLGLKSHRIFQVDEPPDSREVLSREAESFHQAGKEAHLAQVELKAVDPDPLQGFHGHLDDLGVAGDPLTADVLDSKLEGLALPAAPGSFVAQDVAAIT